MVAFTKTIAREAASSGVTANAVCPGPDRDADAQRDGRRARRTPSDCWRRCSRAVPMRRLGRPEDVAAAVAFFAREDAGYITGQTLSVSGGLTMA